MLPLSSFPTALPYLVFILTLGCRYCYKQFLFLTGSYKVQYFSIIVCLGVGCLCFCLAAAINRASSVYPPMSLPSTVTRVEVGDGGKKDRRHHRVTVINFQGVGDHTAEKDCHMQMYGPYTHALMLSVWFVANLSLYEHGEAPCLLLYSSMVWIVYSYHAFRVHCYTGLPFDFMLRAWFAATLCVCTLAASVACRIVEVLPLCRDTRYLS